MDKRHKHEAIKVIVSEALTELLSSDFEGASARETDVGMQFCLTVKWDGVGKLGGTAHKALRRLIESDVKNGEMTLQRVNDWLDGSD